MEEQEITPQETTPTEETPPDWKARAEAAEGRLGSLEPQYKSIQRQLSKAQQSPKFDATEIEDRIINRLGPAFDALYSRDSDDAEPTRKPTPSELLKRQQAANPTFDESKLDDLVQRRTFENLLDMKGIEFSDPTVQEAIEYAQEHGLSVGKTVQRIEKAVDKRAKDAKDKEATDRETLKQQIAKDEGWTAPDGKGTTPTDRAELKRLYVENPYNPRAAEWEAIRNQR